jgi:hypothetical protein
MAYPPNCQQINLGTHILVAGLSIQVASLFVFTVCAVEFMFRVGRLHSLRNTEHEDVYTSRRFKIFLQGTFSLPDCTL